MKKISFLQEIISFFHIDKEQFKYLNNKIWVIVENLYNFILNKKENKTKQTFTLQKGVKKEI